MKLSPNQQANWEVLSHSTYIERETKLFFKQYHISDVFRQMSSQSIALYLEQSGHSAAEESRILKKPQALTQREALQSALIHLEPASLAMQKGIDVRHHQHQ
jgi:hypothetical protein